MMSVIPLPNLTTGVPPDTTIARIFPGTAGADGTEHVTEVPGDRNAQLLFGMCIPEPVTVTTPGSSTRSRPATPRQEGMGSLRPALTPAVTGRDPSVRLNRWPHSGQATARHFGWPQQFPSWGMMATQGRPLLPQGTLSRAQGGPFSLKLSG